MKKQKIGIVGHTGMVGTQVFDFFKSKGHYALGHSKDKKTGYKQSRFEELNKNCDVIFVSVPTPFDYKKGKPDFKIVKNVISKIKGNKTVVLKSTVWPGTTDSLQKKHANLKLLFNPEFLSRSTAKENFIKPDRQIVGYTAKSKTQAKKILNLLPKGKYNNIVKASEAELIKYSHNMYGAMRIIYANHLYEVSEKMGIDYKEVRQGFAASEFVGSGALRYMNIFHHGNKRGYGGACFPKDVNNYIKFCESIGVKVELVKATKSANLRILKSQNMGEVEAEKKL